MKAVFRKIARIKKRKAIKRAIVAGVVAYLSKYGRINQTTDLFIHSSQEIQSTNNQKTYTVTDDDNQSLIESKSVNSTRVKTGSGAVIEIQNQQNQTSEALKVRGGFRFDAASFVKNDVVDLHKAYQEVLRRAAKLGAENFDVPFGEKPIIENSIKNNVQIGSPVIIINNQETGNV